MPLDIDIVLIPFGMTEYKRTLGHIYIDNDGTGTPELGNYNVEFSDGAKVRVEGHKRSDDVFTLLYLALSRKFGA